nr:class I SAM-dependent methyltransferase [uncultured Cellulosilyticum sp.]
MRYNPENTKEYYNRAAEKEWERLTKNRMGELIYNVHLDILRRYITNTDYVIELGAGGGRYTKDLVKMAGMLVTSDLSPVQVKVNKNKMRALKLETEIEDFKQLDIAQMPQLQDKAYDVVVCIGGALNYLFEREEDAINEMLRILKPGGKLILGVMSKIGSLMYYMEGMAQEKEKFGIEATRWLFETGIQDEEHYPVPSKHYVHMMTSSQVDALLVDKNVKILEKSSAGLFSHAKEEILGEIKYDKELWDCILKNEILFTKNPGTLDCGINMIYVIQKM